MSVGDRLIALHQLPEHIRNIGQKVLHGQVSLVNLLQSLFPFCGKLGRLELFWQNGDKCRADGRGDEACDLFGLSSLHESGGNQLFQNPGAGGGSSNSFALCVAGHFRCSGVLHGGEDRVLRVMLGRGCLSAFDQGIGYREGLTFG